MKKVYLVFSILGFVLPNIFVIIESVETGNILLWLDPTATISGMFNNNISTVFVVDLLVSVLVFFYWTLQESKKYQINKIWLIWLLTLLFGIAGSLPLFLYWRESTLEKT